MTLTLEITSEEVVRTLRDRAQMHGRSVEEEAIAAIASLTPTAAEYEERRRRAIVSRPKHKNWDGLNELLSKVSPDLIGPIDKLPLEERKELFP